MSLEGLGSVCSKFGVKDSIQLESILMNYFSTGNQARLFQRLAVFAHSLLECVCTPVSERNQVHRKSHSRQAPS